MRTTTTRVVTAMAAALLLLSGCVTSNQTGGSSSNASVADTGKCTAGTRERNGQAPPTKKTGRLKVGISPTAMDTYYQRVLAGVAEGVDDAGGTSAYQIDVQAPTSQSATDDQVRSVESWIAQDYDAIVVALFNESALEPLFKRAADKGIAVFTFNSPIVCSPHVVSDIGYDQSKGGRAQAQWIIDHYGNQKRKIAILEGLPGPHTSERMRGFNAAIKGHDNLQIVARQPAGWTRDQGQSVTENMLQAHPETNTLVALYDEMALGGLAAIKAAGKDGKIDVIGYENIKQANDAIKTGDMVATVDTGAKTVGHNIVKTIESYVRNGKDVPTSVFNNVTVYDASNIDKFNPQDYVYVPKAER